MNVHAFAAPAMGQSLIETVCELPPLRPGEVAVEVSHCAICHSDLHLLDGDWSSAKFPLVPGHEVIGTVVAIGRAVTTIAVGSLVGIGWQSGCCGECSACQSGHENLCSQGKERTCVGRAGGFAARLHASERFVFQIPEGLSPAEAAPLLCAGVTVFSPLEKFGPLASPSLLSKRPFTVAIIGMGGLGHLAVQFAAAMGAHVTVFDPQPTKLDEAKRLGASAFFSMAELEAANPALFKDRFDLVLSTTHAALDWNAWLARTALNGTFCLTGVPPTNKMNIDPEHLMDGQKRLTGSVIGSPQTMKRMLAFAALRGIKAMIEEMPFAAANAALDKVRRGEARYRIVLKR